jgi:hypothetical protein
MMSQAVFFRGVIDFSNQRAVCCVSGVDFVIITLIKNLKIV